MNDDSQLKIACGPRDGKGNRFVVATCNGLQHRDTFDTNGEWRRRKFREACCHKFGLPDDAHEFIEEQIIAKADAADIARSEPLRQPAIVTLSDVEAESVEWQWRNRIPIGKLSLWAGPQGIGKSMAVIDAGSRITTGTPWPTGDPCPQGDILMIATEDGAADTLRPRFDAHGADVSRVHLLSGITTPTDDPDKLQFITLSDIDVIDAALKRFPNARMLSIDPIGSHFGDEKNSYKDNEVRAVLAPLATLAARHRVAVVLVAHTRKAAAKSADDTVLGSRAFTAIARVVWHFATDPDLPTRRLMLPGKNNLAPRQQGLAFDIGGEPGHVRWESGTVDYSADDIIGESSSQRGDSKTDKAIEVIQRVLANGPRGSQEVEDACKDEGISRGTYWKARKTIGLVKEKTEFNGEWMVSLPDYEEFN